MTDNVKQWKVNHFCCLAYTVYIYLAYMSTIRTTPRLDSKWWKNFRIRFFHDHGKTKMKGATHKLED